MRNLLAHANGLRPHVAAVGLALVLGLTVSAAGSGLGALPPVGSFSTATTYGQTLTIARPATTASGDVLVASLDARLDGTSAVTPPAGWNLIRRDASTPGYSALTQALYYKVAGSAEPATYSWGLASTVSAAGSVSD